MRIAAAPLAAKNQRAHMIAIFDNDAEYSGWLAAHPDDYVVNTRSGYSPSYMVLHRSSCSTIDPSTSSSDAGAFTERGYIKICATNLESLRSLARALGRKDGSFSAECSKCAQ
jgi:hypothetical protein